MINLASVNSLTLSKLAYPTLPSAVRPVPHSEEIPVPVFHTLEMLTDEMSSSSQSSVDSPQKQVKVIIAVFQIRKCPFCLIKKPLMK